PRPQMAKTPGNLTLVADLLRHHEPAAVRLLLLDRPWRDAWEYRVDDLHAAAAKLERLYAAAGRPSGHAGAEEVIAALLNDLDVPRAVAVALDSGGGAARALIRRRSLA